MENVRFSYASCLNVTGRPTLAARSRMSMLWFVPSNLCLPPLLTDYLFVIITNLGDSGFSYFYADLSDSDTNEQTAVARSTLSLPASKLGRVFILLTFSHKRRWHTKARRRPLECHPRQNSSFLKDLAVFSLSNYQGHISRRLVTHRFYVSRVAWRSM